MSDDLYVDGSGRLFRQVGGGGGCVGCLAFLVIGFGLYFCFNLGTFAYKRYMDRQIESQRVQVAPATLDSYTGRYNYGRYKIKIERRGNKLITISEEEFCELMPIATEFIYKNCANGFQGRARFERDGRGNLVLVVVHRNGRIERAAKVD